MLFLGRWLKHVMSENPCSNPQIGHAIMWINSGEGEKEREGGAASL